MQERRASIRIRHPARIQYCSSEDLLTRDGQLRDLSDRGAGLLARESHRCGEMVTVGLQLPGDQTTWTATGVVRWVDAPAGRWHPIGLDWLQLEEAARNRLHHFLETRPEAAGPPRKSRPAPTRRLAFWSLFFSLTAVTVIAGYTWVRALEWENQQLSTGIEHRDDVINQLQHEEGRLTIELDATRTQLAETSAQIGQLDAQAQGFGQEVSRLTEQVDQFQASYVKMREEREQLMQRVLELEQEKLALTSRLTSMEQLRQAVREAIDARKSAAAAQRESMIRAQRTLDQQMLSIGNQGFVIRGGRPPGNRAPAGMRVRVLDPEERP